MSARDRHVPWWDLEWRRAADHDYLDSVRYQRECAAFDREFDPWWRKLDGYEVRLRTFRMIVVDGDA